MDEPKTEGTSTLSMGEIYYVLFKHKWKILGFALVGLAAAAAVYKNWPDTIYRSSAKLFVRYVQEAGIPVAVTDDAQVKSTDQRGETIMNGEIEILTSMDLAKQVAANIGPERVLEAFGGGSDVSAAAGVIRGGLEASTGRGSRVITLTFQHPDASVVEPVLSMLISEYMKKHLEIHMKTGLFDEILAKETQVLRTELTKTEEALRQIQDQAGILSLDETKRAYAEQISRVRQQISDAEGELAERRALFEDFEKSQVPVRAVPAAKAQEYRTVVGALDTLNRRQQELLITFSAESAVMVNLRKRIAENLEAKERLELEYPALAAQTNPLAAVAAASGGATPAGFDAFEQRSRIRALETRVNVLQEHLGRIRAEASNLGGLEMSITDLQRKKDLQETQYRYFATSLEKARINEALGSGRVSNISVIQTPTPPVRDVGKLFKVVAALALGGLGFGLVLAFVLELFLDQTIRRPSEIESTLGLPLFFSIPNIRGMLRSGRSKVARLAAPADGDKGKHARWPVHPEIESYFDALRDRLIFYFEVRGLTKKPKLIAVTSCGDRSGVSTVAAGLAASLSMTGEGNVLLVDMNMDQHAPYQFRKGTVQVGLDELLDGEKREEALVQDKLYVVPHATGSGRFARILPKRFTDIIPRLRASDYDYIIFDMPAVSQVSVTPQLARFMDMVFLMVESEKTNRDAVKRASNLLSQVSCTLGVIVNRTRNYLPRALLQEV